MPKKKGRRKQTVNAGRGGGRGQGRGAGGGRGPNIVQQNLNRPRQGVIGRQQQKSERKRDAKLRRKGQLGVGPGIAVQNGGTPLGKPVEEVREDGFLRHQEIPRAHADAIMAIVMAPDFIYTGSRDKTLKRWKVGRNPQTNRFELAVDVEVPLGELCWSMVMAGDWIFCGLGDGTIKGFNKNGAQAVLQGHTKRVNALMIHQHVIISGSSDGAVKMWQADPSGSTFNCTNTISEGLSSSVACMAVLAEHLWVGGTSGVAVVELASLRVVSQIQPKKFVAGFQEFNNHMIVAYADGQMCIFDVGGVKKLDQPANPEAGPILSVAGLECGPRFLCGHSKGQVSSIMLPSFQLRKCWQALERAKVQSICCGVGQDGIFLLGAENGNLQVWQRDASVP